MSWDYREYLRERRIFLTHRGEYHPMVFATTVIFTVTWLAGWLVSTALLMLGVTSMPLRYALAFTASYGVFFGCVRLWCNSVHRDRGNESIDFSGFSGGEGEGCLIVFVVALAALVVAAMFWATGGFAALLEVAFEVAFAGTVVRRLGRTEIVGDWAGRLFSGTWPHALAALTLLVGGAAWLQSMAPGAVTFAAAARAIWR